MAKTKIGIEENAAGVLCYVLGWFSGIIMFVIERENKFVKFHALQSIVVFLGLMILNILVGVIPVLGATIGLLIVLLIIFLWIFLMVKAFKGEKYMVPFAGDFVENTLMAKADDMANQASKKAPSDKDKKEDKGQKDKKKKGKKKK
ncbi:MAG: DUF4870 domain-containing protein [Elusimicrobiota bacterium]